MSPWKAMRSSPATPARITMPYEYASRSPRKPNWRGMYPSPARIAASRGNALKLVLTARKRISAVATWSATKSGDPSPKTAVPELGDRGRPAADDRRAEPHPIREEHEADKQHAQEDRHHRHGVRRVLGFRWFEGGHPVGDRLHAGQGNRSPCERSQQQEDRQDLRSRRWHLGRDRNDRKLAGHRPGHPDADGQQRQPDEQVRRQGEDVARLAKAAQVADRDQGDRGDPDLDPYVVETRPDRVRLGDRRRGRDGDRHHVVDHQGARGDEPEDLPEVLLCHGIGTTTRRVGPADLAVRGRHHGEHQGDRQRDPDRVLQRQHAAREQRDEDLVRRVRCR